MHTESKTWWDEFIEALEHPEVVTYDFLRDSILETLEIEGDFEFKDALLKLYQKGRDELYELRDLKELQQTIKGLENKKLFFPDPRVRVCP